MMSYTLFGSCDEFCDLIRRFRRPPCASDYLVYIWSGLGSRSCGVNANEFMFNICKCVVGIVHFSLKQRFDAADLVVRLVDAASRLVGRGHIPFYISGRDPYPKSGRPYQPSRTLHSTAVQHSVQIPCIKS